MALSDVFRIGGQLSRGRIAMIRIAGAPPVKSRVPTSGWVLAGIVTLFSIASSLMDIAPSTTLADQGPAPKAHHASVN
jgi:hypothetical protein